MKTRLLLAVLAVVVTPVIALAQAQAPVADSMQSWVGKRLILLGYGGYSDSELKKADLSKPPTTCSTAVEILGVSHSGRDLRFNIESIGSVQLAPRLGTSMVCPSFDKKALKISGVTSTDLEPGLDALVGRLLMTPEAFLAAHGAPFERPFAPVGEGFGGQNAIPAQALLTVTAGYSGEGRKSRIKGTVEALMTIGSDGRVHSLQIRKPLGSGLDEQVLRVLPMWRFDPALVNGTPVATRVNIQMNFSLR